jgi:hypothetical protein
LARSVSPSFNFVWDGGVVYGSYDPMTQGAWPGASYCDYIGSDVYDAQAYGGATGWAEVVAGLAEGIAFAQANGKTYAISEFGLDDYGDDWQWFEAAYWWMRANAASLGFVLLFNDGASSPHSLNQNPQSQAIWTKRFAAWNQQLQGSPAVAMQQLQPYPTT